MKIYKKRIIPLRKQLLLAVACFFAGISIITSVTCSLYTDIHTSILKTDMDLYASQLSISVTEIYRTCRNIATSLSYNQMIQNYLIADEPSEKYEDYKLAYNQITSLMELSPYLKDIAIISNNGNTAIVNGDHKSYEALIGEAEPQTHSLSSCGLASVKDTECQILSMPIYHLATNSTSHIGFLFLAVDINTFFEENPVTDADYIAGYIMADSSQNIISGNSEYYSAILRQPNDSELRIDSTTYLVNRYSMPIINNMFYILINEDMISAEGSQIAAIHFAGMAIVLIVITFIIFRLYNPLIRSLQTLTGYMKTISSEESGNYKDGIQIDQGILGSTEIEDISSAFNHMLRRIYALNRTIFDNHTHMYEMEINNKKTEIAFLRSQINPHFLYNTLTMICGMASVGMKQEIVDTASSLSQIFRYAIKGSEMVTLSQELEIVQSYLQIQLYRFEDRFTVHYDISEESLPCMIPKMILQPIIENAIVHGLEPSMKQGRLEIGARRNHEKGFLVIWVYDTGVGMSEEQKEQIRRSLQAPVHTLEDTIMESYQNIDSRHHDNIGLFNVNNRMQLYFGLEYSLTLDSEEGIGTNIQFRIPYQTSANTKDGRK